VLPTRQLPGIYIFKDKNHFQLYIFRWKNIRIFKRPITFVLSGSKEFSLKNDKQPAVYTAKTVAGMEEILQRELDMLGAANTRILKRAVSFEATRHCCTGPITVAGRHCGY